MRRPRAGRCPGRGPRALAAATVVTADQRMPRSPSTVRVTGVLATTSRARPSSVSAVSGSISTTECTSVVAPPTSTTTTSPAPGRSVDAQGEQLDPGEHDVRGGAADHRGEVGPRGEVLAADHVGQEHLADRGPRRVGGEHADPGHDVVRDDVGYAALRQDRCELGLRVDVAGHHDRPGPAGGDQRPGGGEHDLGVAAVGAAGQQHHVGLAGAHLPGPAVVGTTRHADDVDDLAAAGQRDPASGLGGDQLLVADHGDPEPSPGAGAGQHRRVRGAGVLPGQRGQARVVPVEHVGVDRGAVRGRGDDGAARRGRPARPW